MAFSPFGLLPPRFTLSGVQMPSGRPRFRGQAPIPSFIAPAAAPSAGARRQIQFPPGKFSGLANGQGTFPTQQPTQQQDPWTQWLASLSQGPPTPSGIMAPRPDVGTMLPALGALGLSQGILGRSPGGQAPFGGPAFGPTRSAAGLGSFLTGPGFQRLAGTSAFANPALSGSLGLLGGGLGLAQAFGDTSASDARRMLGGIGAGSQALGGAETLSPGFAGPVGKFAGPVGLLANLGLGALDISEGNIGRGAGSLGGTALGAGIGSIFPGIGTFLGAGLGGGLGGLFGGLFGGKKPSYKINRNALYRARVAREANQFQGAVQGATDLSGLFDTLRSWQSGYVGGSSPRAVGVSVELPRAWFATPEAAAETERRGFYFTPSGAYSKEGLQADVAQFEGQPGAPAFGIGRPNSSYGVVQDPALFFSRVLVNPQGTKATVLGGGPFDFPLNEFGPRLRRQVWNMIQQNPNDPLAQQILQRLKESISSQSMA